ncbi:hypothetical protein ACEWY4_012991 [Coilia grayii]|uniref:Cadherin domain-containing protein n=1 Tax=Coilia grayii TaxID=363190 RepID=A0ABD1JV07_9TELE
MFSLTWAEHHLREKRAWIIDSFSIEEEHPGPYPYKLGEINVDRKYRVSFELQGRGVDEEPIGLLSIDPETGILLVHRKIDYEELDDKVLKLSFVARNRSNLQIDTRLGVEIIVEDINDNPPLFQNTPYVVYVKESAAQGSYVITVLAHDKDEAGAENAMFDYRITAVTPNTPNAEFFISDQGAISFRGCLDYDQAQKYMITVEAKDHGKISLSSSTTVVVHVQDANNHLPVISGHSGTGIVKEGETGSSPIQIHVTDKDSQGSAAWRAKFTLHGKLSTFFSVDTDPATNDGILTLIKPLDFECGAKKAISVSVENEQAYFSCKVKEKTKQGLWTVVATKGVETSSSTIRYQEFTITVEDTNDPPMFKIPVKDVVVVENEGLGQLIETFTAVDGDTTYSNTFVYKIGHDPANWVRIDSETGDIFLVEKPDRESMHVVGSIYTVIIWAVDNGKPPMTGTATLHIHVKDQNDNLPMLNATSISMCATDRTTEAVIWAHDLDGEPFGGPFMFELLNDHKGWTLDPHYGMSATLKKESVVFAGHHTLMLKILDKQGQFSMHNLSVTVCDCSMSTNCLMRQTGSTTAAVGTVAIVFLALFLLLGALLMTVFISCARENTMIEVEDGPGYSLLLKSNTEMSGTDCKVLTEQMCIQNCNNTHLKLNNTDQKLISTDQKLISRYGFIQNNSQQMTYKHESCYDIYSDTQQNLCGKYNTGFQGKNAIGAGMFHSMAALAHNEEYYNQYLQKTSHQYRSLYQHRNAHFKEIMRTQHRDVAHDEFTIGDQVGLKSLLEARLSSIKTLEEELCDYEPHEYAYEEDSETPCDLDPIHIKEPAFDPDELLNLDPSFFPLALICKPLPEGY